MSLLKALPAAALLFLPSSAATVHSVSVVPSSGKTEVVIGVNAAVEVQDFTLDAPARVVVDLKGATLDMSNRTYDKVARGGITNVRYSQFRPNIVRVVIEMDGKHPYDVRRNDAEVRVTVSGGTTSDYSSWSSNKSANTSEYAAASSAAPARSLPPVSATKAPADAVRAPMQTTAPAGAIRTPVQTVAPKIVAQIEAQPEQPDTQYDPPTPAPALLRSVAALDKPVALFSQAQQSQQ